MITEEKDSFVEDVKWFKKRFPTIKDIWRNEKKDHVYTTVKLKDGRVATVKSPHYDNVELGILWAYTKVCEQKIKPTRHSNYSDLLKRFTDAKNTPIFGGMDICDSFSESKTHIHQYNTHPICPTVITDEDRKKFNLQFRAAQACKSITRAMDTVLKIDGIEHHALNFQIKKEPTTVTIKADTYKDLSKIAEIVDKAVRKLVTT